MRILIAHNFYQHLGGEDVIFEAEARLLESRGHEVVRYTLHNDQVNSMGRARLFAATFWNRDSAREIGRIIAERRIDVAHFHNTLPLISPAAYSAARNAGAAVVQTLHNYRLICPDAFMLRDQRVCQDCLGRRMAWPAVVHGCYRGSRAASLVVAGMLAAHRLAGTWDRAVDRYIAVTQFGRQVLVDGGLPAEKVVVKPYFVSPDPGGGEGRGGYAVFVGRLSAEKGIQTLLDAWERMPDVPLKILGDGPLAQRVQQAAERMPQVQWIGRRPQEEVCRIVGDAAMLVFPSLWYEGLPKTILESFAKGTPVVASRIGAMIEMIEHGRTGAHFAPGEPLDLVAQVRAMWNDPGRLARARQEARREYQARYTPERNYPMLMGVYHEAIAHAAGERRPEYAWQA